MYSVLPRIFRVVVGFYIACAMYNVESSSIYLNSVSVAYIIYMYVLTERSSEWWLITLWWTIQIHVHVYTLHVMQCFLQDKWRRYMSGMGPSTCTLVHVYLYLLLKYNKYTYISTCTCTQERLFSIAGKHFIPD